MDRRREVPYASTMITSRLARPDEIPQLIALQWRASLQDDAYAEDLKANPDAIELPASQVGDGHVFVAEHDGMLAGFAVALPRADGDFDLDGLFVDPPHQRYGIGRELADRCVAHALIHGAEVVRVISAPAAVGFYEACGFVETGTVETRFGPAIDMELVVAQR